MIRFVDKLSYIASYMQGLDMYTLVLCRISVSELCLCLGDTVLYIDCHVDCVDG